jgi:hypothetical protein
VVAGRLAAVIVSPRRSASSRSLIASEEHDTGDSDIHLRTLWIAAITILPLIPSVILFRALNSIGEVEVRSMVSS